ncbi:MAG: hypothetical protein KJ556_10910 [Gammaproteobacteria bacterium]|nr:hypothetical protein [Gammaproteobacteria bacterium]MBU2057646.1 hypothetical protein [Gammaproteobacteria bacterium]MBU2175626.1 hypothetical protein [Gammaproteobacteria bacterium]MBU2245998.1 hypothetical protein [Gammaproteobacteria bacterium]MBU2346424.1 hypothetical protein [Gammaproteobacteria bacterium]
MSYENKARRIRADLSKYTTASVVNELLNALHDKTPIEHEGMRRAWLLCLALDWTLELQPTQEAIKIDRASMDKILNKIWNLQSYASDISAESYELPLRAMMIQQLEFQRPKSEHLLFMFRLHNILFRSGKTETLVQDFESITGLKLIDYFALAIWTHHIFINKQTSVIPYENIIEELYPGYSIDQLSKFFKNLGGTLPELKRLYEKPSDRKLFKYEYFCEPASLKRPFLFLPKGLSTPHSYVLSKGVCEFVLRRLKSSDPERFKNKFTVAFEEYVSDILKNLNPSIMRETEIQAIYASKNVSGKCVDFLLHEGNNIILIDAKCAEPQPNVLSSDNPLHIADRIKANMLKGVQQVGETIKNLEKLDYANLPDIDHRYSVIVTHQDFYIRNLSKLTAYLGEDKSMKYNDSTSGSINQEKLMFISIDHFEAIAIICKAANRSISDFISFVVDAEKSHITECFAMIQYIEKYAKSVGVKRSFRESSHLRSSLESGRENLGHALNTSKNYWRNKNSDEGIRAFIRAYYELKSELLQAQPNLLV